MMQQIEFILHADGRVEERVIGLVGKDCIQLTQAVEEKLGTVIRSEPTQEQYQQSTVTETVSSWS